MERALFAHSHGKMASSELTPASVLTCRHVRTVKAPVQPIPLFEELIALIMEPDNRHVTLNIDCKMQNDPETMFVSTHRSDCSLLSILTTSAGDETHHLIV